MEFFRNIPLLLQIFFWYFAALRALPLTVDSINFYDISFLNVKGWYVPKFVWTNFSIFIYSIIFAFILILGPLITIHELGHFIAARYVGIRVERFSVGMPPRFITITSVDNGYLFRLFFFKRNLEGKIK